MGYGQIGEYKIVAFWKGLVLFIYVKKMVLKREKKASPTTLGRNNLVVFLGFFSNYACGGSLSFSLQLRVLEAYRTTGLLIVLKFFFTIFFIFIFIFFFFSYRVRGCLALYTSSGYLWKLFIFFFLLSFLIICFYVWHYLFLFFI